ncbi:Ankyrin repeat and SOCS box protein 18 [Varanus komodoensis]|nr:Ankyrin repeat and SOCS box protein 18 [Varanus komodoensis]
MALAGITGVAVRCDSCDMFALLPHERQGYTCPQCKLVTLPEEEDYNKLQLSIMDEHSFTLPGPAVEKRQIFEKEGPEFPWKRPVPVDKYYEALLAGNLKVLQALMDQYCADTGVVFEINTNELEWQVKSHAAFGLSGLWSLEYKRTLTNPLCISASHGHTACLRHLLFRRADPNAAPGGRSALHEACTGGHTDCAELLLEHKANPNLLDEDGHAPLHLCTSQNTLGFPQYPSELRVAYMVLVRSHRQQSRDLKFKLIALITVVQCVVRQQDGEPFATTSKTNLEPPGGTRHINFIEMPAIHKALITFQSFLHGHHVQIVMDNTTMGIQHQLAGEQSLAIPLIKLAIRIWDWCINKNITLMAIHVGGYQLRVTKEAVGTYPGHHPSQGFKPQQLHNFN